MDQYLQNGDELSLARTLDSTEKSILRIALETEGHNAKLGKLLQYYGSFSKVVSAAKDAEITYPFGRGRAWDLLRQSLRFLGPDENNAEFPPSGPSGSDASPHGGKRDDTDLLTVLTRCQEKQICLSLITDETYPPLLKTIADPPAVLFYRGDLTLANKKAAAIVGSRKAGEYGKKAAYEIACELSKEGVAIVSGMALGIDRAAHMGAMDCGGFPIAVMPTGLDSCYPRSNEWLMNRVLMKGLVISEYPPGAEFMKAHFVERNRLISGLCQATVVCEAGPKSGSILTAQYAADQGRDVFVVPGSIFDFSFLGSHNLIRDGANILTGPVEILRYFGKMENEQLSLEDPETKPAEESGLDKPGKTRKVNYHTAKIPEGTEEEVMNSIRSKDQENKALAGPLMWLYEWLDDFGQSSEELVKKTGKSPAELMQAVTLLEVKGLLTVSGGMIRRK